MGLLTKGKEEDWRHLATPPPQSRSQVRLLGTSGSNRTHRQCDLIRSENLRIGLLVLVYSQAFYIYKCLSWSLSLYLQKWASSWNPRQWCWSCLNNTPDKEPPSWTVMMMTLQIILISMCWLVAGTDSCHQKENHQKIKVLCESL